VIHTLPALTALRAHRPEARITWVVEKAAAELVLGHPALDRVLVSRRQHWVRGLATARSGRHLRAVHRFIRSLRDTRYDVVLDFQALLKGAVWVALARGERKIGFDRGMAHQEQSWRVLNERIPPVSMEIHALTRNLMMLAPLGIRTRDVVYGLPVSPEHRRRMRTLVGAPPLSGDGPLVAFNPGAKWATKLWDPARFARLADRMVRERRIRPVFTGGAADRPMVAGILAGMTAPAVNLAGRTTLMELAALYAGCDLVVTTDTGPMHLAAAVDTPVVALFGPTAPWRTGPYGDRHRVVRADLSCSPCFQRRCETRRCMDRITVDAVFTAAVGVLSPAVSTA
jgi:3-deoxy-D-manno-octulosonic-acid transferase/heptosyltransferase-1